MTQGPGSQPPPRMIRTHPPSRPPDGPRRGRLTNKRILLGVTGSIAAYKAAIVARALIKEGAETKVILTSGGARFVGAATFAGITQNPVLSDMFAPDMQGELHVDLAARADLIVVAPATADILARFAGGRADDLLTATVLCAQCPVLVAPAMHPAMWNHPAMQRNVAVLEADGRIERVGPIHGEVASGDSGVGRMVEPDEIVSAAVLRLSPRDLQGRHLVVTAGPTIEDLDPVRFISNRSSGKMGFAIAERAAARGARVTLIAGPVSLNTPYGVQRIDVRSAVAMRGAVWQALGPDLSHADALIMAAAVGDYRPAETRAAKMKRGAKESRLDLVQNPDILAEVGQARKKGGRPILVGFAVETDTDEKVIEYARGKLAQKRADVIVANHADDSFGRDDNRITLVTHKGVEPQPRLSKIELSDRIVDWIAGRFETR